MTKRLYYADSYLKDFSARVIGCRRAGDKAAVILDRTAFYPASGGQPHDTGTIGGVRVESVEEGPDGEILHIVEQSIPQGIVEGRIDWERRFDHMQQHSGQHILSQAFLRTAQASTLSFHLGQETSTLDVGLPDPTSPAVREAEAAAVRIVFEDRPIHILTVEKGDLGSLGVRKGSEREGDIRIIEVEGFDRSPCGGTHVRRTGEIGLIFILGSERYKGGTRIEFICGRRVLKSYRQDHDTLRQLGLLYSAHPRELPGLTERLQQEKSSLSRENFRLRNQILDFEAQELLEHADKSVGLLTVRKSFADRPIDDLKALAQRIAARPEALAMLAVSREPAQVVVARGAAVKGDCGSAIRQITASLGGRGGGKPELAQAGGISLAALEGWLGALESYFRNSLG